MVNVHQLERISYYPSYFQNQTKYPSHAYEGRLYHMKITQDIKKNSSTQKYIVNQPECMKTYCILGNEITYKSSTAPNNCQFHIVRMEMSNSQDAQITKMGKIYKYRHTHTVALHVTYFRAQMWSLKTEGGKKNTVTSTWDIINRKLNNIVETSK
jgi:hypothetical protein